MHAGLRVSATVRNSAYVELPVAYPVANHSVVQRIDTGTRRTLEQKRKQCMNRARQRGKQELRGKRARGEKVLQVSLTDRCGMVCKQSEHGVLLIIQEHKSTCN